MPETLVEVLPHVPQLLRLGIQKLQGIDVDHNLQSRHFLDDESFPHDLIHE